MRRRRKRNEGNVTVSTPTRKVVSFGRRGVGADGPDTILAFKRRRHLTKGDRERDVGR